MGVPEVKFLGSLSKIIRYGLMMYVSEIADLASFCAKAAWLTVTLPTVIEGGLEISVML